jgi:bifunctional DNA-binding transcriptional regulator/antitoxin component of YhaV-PrlF toxin-antitoxin module
MQLQKQVSRKVGDRKYPKYMVVIPPKTIMELGWEQGDELTAQVAKGKLIITKKEKSGKRTDR